MSRTRADRISVNTDKIVASGASYAGWQAADAHFVKSKFGDPYSSRTRCMAAPASRAKSDSGFMRVTNTVDHLMNHRESITKGDQHVLPQAEGGEL